MYLHYKFTENKEDCVNFFTKRIKLPPVKYATDTDTIKDGTLIQGKKKKTKKLPQKSKAEELNNSGLLDKVRKR